MPDRAVLARAVDALQHHQHGVTPIRIELGLQLLEALAILLQLAVGGLLLGPAQVAIRILVAQARLVRRAARSARVAKSCLYSTVTLFARLRG